MNGRKLCLLLKRGFDILADENDIEVEVEDGVFDKIAKGCGGDVRKALNSVENCFFVTSTKNGKNIFRLKQLRN